MEQRVSLITLGVRDVRCARTFYERLGWRIWVGRSAYMLRGGGEEQNDRTMLLPLTFAAAELLNAGSGQRLLGTPRGP